MKKLNEDQEKKLLQTLEARFLAHPERHEGITWENVLAKLEANPEKLWSLNEMERTGGEPDVIDYDEEKDKYLFIDCSEESPYGRRNICYDRAGQQLAQKHCLGKPPSGNAVDLAKAMGVELTDKSGLEHLYRLVECDGDSWNWVKTPNNLRKRCKALVWSRDGKYFGGASQDRDYKYGYRYDRAFRASLWI